MITLGTKSDARRSSVQKFELGRYGMTAISWADMSITGEYIACLSTLPASRSWGSEALVSGVAFIRRSRRRLVSGGRGESSVYRASGMVGIVSDSAMFGSVWSPCINVEAVVLGGSATGWGGRATEGRFLLLW